MTAPTHIAFAIAISGIFGIQSNSITFAIVGAVLPDIDHPQSLLGRMFPFISYPLNTFFGHRTITHSIWLLIVPFLIGVWFHPVLWVAIGALTHIIIDALNTSGVQLFYPYSKKTVVLANDTFRFPTASKQEFILFLILTVMCWGHKSIANRGGIRKVLEQLTGNYEMALVNYKNCGTAKYYLKGRWRRRGGGELVQGKYVVIGEEKGGMALWDTNSRVILHVPDDIEPLSVYGEKGQGDWTIIRIRGWLHIRKGYGFFYTGSRWYVANKNDVVAGVFKSYPGVEVEFENEEILVP
jgi:inner membrane protein